MKPFIKYLRAQLGMLYVWGGQGENVRSNLGTGVFAKGHEVN